MEIAVRADGSQEIGGGHIMRCLTLAETVCDGKPATFLCRDLNGAPFDEIERRGHRAVRLPADADDWQDDARETLAALDGRRVDWLVTDHYQLDAKWEGRLRRAADRLMVIDDLAGRPHACNLLLDQTPGRAPADYDGLAAEGTRYLLGQDHALIARAFRDRRDATLRRRRERSSVSRILVSFGLADSGNLTSLALSAIEGAGLSPDVRIDVVLGREAPHVEEVAGKCRELVQTARLHLSTTEMAELMSEADIAIGVGGTTSWERCCLGLPALVLVAAENQRPNAAALEERGAAIVLGSQQTISAETLARCLADLVSDPDRLADFADNAAEVFDARAAGWLRIEMQPPRHARDGGEIKLRAAGPDDGETTFEWQRIPETRAFSRSSRIPERDEHFDWFSTRLADRKSYFCIIEHGSEDAGVLRLDAGAVNDGYEISILVAPGKWGLGIGGAALDLAREAVAEARFHAYVLPKNERSRAMFTKAGYVPANDDWLVCEPLAAGSQR